MKNLYQTWTIGGPGYAVLQDKLIVENRRFNNDSVIEEPSIYEWIDLGLPSGLLWASTNVGAEKPEDFGLYFAWGETQGYEGVIIDKQFTWDDYKFGTEDNLIKYNPTDELTQLKLVDDAVYQSNNTCRMPTKADFEELTANTTSTWETLNGVNGRRFTSKNGNSIFVPAAGFCKKGLVRDVGSYGGLWSSSLFEDDSMYTYGWYLYFISDSMNVSINDRCSGLPVRPVKNIN